MGTIERVIAIIIAGLRPVLGPTDQCLFAESCSIYAQRMLKRQRWYRALWLIGLRILSCNPLVSRKRSRF